MIGILLSHTEIERLPGDIGHPGTLNCPAIFETANYPEDFLPLARHLKSKGALAIITEHHTNPDLFQELSIPVYTSPLALLPFLSQTIPGSLAILSDRESAITPKLLQSFQLSQTEHLITTGLDDMPAFTETYVTRTRPLDKDAVEFEMRFVMQRLMKTNPDIGALLLTNPYMSAYRSALRQVTDLPVFDIVSLAAFIHKAYS